MLEVLVEQIYIIHKLSVTGFMQQYKQMSCLYGALQNIIITDVSFFPCALGLLEYVCFLSAQTARFFGAEATFSFCVCAHRSFVVLHINEGRSGVLFQAVNPVEFEQHKIYNIIVL